VSLLTERELGALFDEFTASAFRFETRERYNSEVGRDAFRKYRAGQPDDYAWHRPWLTRIRRDRAAGKVWQRVRIVSVPPSEYTRYGLAVAQLNIEAGEDIRYLRRDMAQRLGLRPYDAWLFDQRILVRLHFDDADDTFQHAETVQDTSIVARHNAWRETAWRYAQSREEFLAEYP
jgi:hypothetical protein